MTDIVITFKIPEELANGNWSKRFINWIEDIRMERASGNFALKVHLEELTNIRNLISDLTCGIRTLAKSEEYRQNVRLLKTVPGISTLTAMILLTELYDISRFTNFDKLCSYLGLIPDMESSGETDLKKGITNRRNAQLRGILIEISWVAVRKDPALLMSFNELSKKMPKSMRSYESPGNF